MRKLLFLLIFSLACRSDKVDIIEYTVVIQPLGQFDPAQVDFVAKKLRLSYKKVEVRLALALPNHTLNKSKSRHRALSIITWLSKSVRKNESVIGITSEDISITKGSIDDYGIMGLGFCPGKACIATTYRLNKKRVNDQLYKIVIHEHGHNLGLPHCPSKGCYMMDAEGKNHTDGLYHFCTKCAKEFEKNNWDIRNL